MEIGLRIPGCAPGDEVADAVAAAERAGFAVAWLPDSQLLWRDVWITAALAAERTSDIVLGTNVTNPLTRHPTVTASAAATLHEVAGPGRVIVGLGSGDSSVRVMGRRTARLAELREAVDVMRQLWRGELVDFAGAAEARLHAPPGEELPVWIAAGGPRMLELAGEIGDGVITVAGITEAALERTRSRIATGAERAGRDGLPIATGLFVHVTDDRSEGMRLARPYAAVYAIRYRDDLEADGIRIDPPDPAPRVYPDLGHAEDWEHAVEVSGWVPDEALERFCDAYCLIGTPEELTSRCRELAGRGIGHLYVRGYSSYELPHELCAAFGDTVIPALAGSS